MYCSDPNCDNCNPYQVCEGCGEKLYGIDDEEGYICNYCGHTELKDKEE